MTDRVVIVGGGQAAVQLCIALRKNKFEGEVLVLSEEQDLPYHRPPLSKAFITGKTDEQKLAMRPASFYASKNINLQLNNHVKALVPDQRQVVTTTGAEHYDKLVLATGAIARKLPIEGIEADGVVELRDLTDARAIRKLVENRPDVVVIGAGFIGLEAAAAVNCVGLNVTVFDMADRVMGRAVSPEVSEWFTDRHEKAGIKIHLNESVARIITDSRQRVSGVERANGEFISAAVVLVGIGVLPQSSLAEAAGLRCDNGIVVDEFCRTSNASIFAVGDCANHPNRFAGGRQLRLESVQNATDQARTVAAIIASHRDDEKQVLPYSAVPWFWSDQAEHSLQMAGLAFDVDNRVIRGDPQAGGFSVFQFNGHRLVAVDSVNVPRDHMLARKMLAAEVSPTPAQAADIEFDLKSLL